MNAPELLAWMESIEGWQELEMVSAICIGDANKRHDQRPDHRAMIVDCMLGRLLEEVRALPGSLATKRLIVDWFPGCVPAVTMAVDRCREGSGRVAVAVANCVAAEIRKRMPPSPSDIQGLLTWLGSDLAEEELARVWNQCVVYEVDHLGRNDFRPPLAIGVRHILVSRIAEEIRGLVEDRHLGWVIIDWLDQTETIQQLIAGMMCLTPHRPFLHSSQIEYLMKEVSNQVGYVLEELWDQPSF